MRRDGQEREFVVRADGRYPVLVKGHASEEQTRPIRRTGLTLAIGIVLVVSLATGIIWATRQYARSPSGGAPAKDYVSLTIGLDPATGLDQYSPANFSVPAGVPVQFTITNHDNGTNPVANSVGVVRGTVDGTESLSLPGQAAQIITALPGNQVSHTFTVESGGVYVSVAIPAATSSSQPTVVTFTVVFGTPGSYVWMCMAPCDMQAMGVPGFMTGTITVVSG
jgi:plastocyanin